MYLSMYNIYGVTEETFQDFQYKDLNLWLQFVHRVHCHAVFLLKRIS